MSEDQSPSQEAPAEAAQAAPRVRRISNPRPKKAATKEVAGAEPAAEPKEPKDAAAAPADAPTAKTVTDAQAAQDWPDAETVSDASRQSANDKRKRRRRKGKGGGQGGPNPQGQAGVHEEVAPLVEPPAPKEGAPASSVPSAAAQAAPAPAPRPVQAPASQPQQQPQHAPRVNVNQEQLAKRAWKIFLAEVSEEGVSLISDQDARELSKRCFRLAEIFLDEQGRKLR